MDRLDLGTARSVPALVATTFALWFAHLHVFVTLALLVVGPLDLLVDGWWAGTLDGRGDPGIAARIASLFVGAVPIPALVTAMHVAAVQDVAAGLRPRVRRAAGRALRAFPAVAAVVAAYLFVTWMGLFLLVVPGVWIAVRWYFGAQAVVADGRRLGDALDVSERLTEGAWWRTFGVLVLFGLIAAAAGVPLGLALDTLPDVAYGVAAVLRHAALASLGALAGTLLFFDLRARKGLPLPGPGAQRRSGPERGPADEG